MQRTMHMDWKKSIGEDSIKMTKRGLFITLECGEGGGKTTHLQFIYEHLVSRGHDVVKTREPGGTPTCEEIRNILLHKKEAKLSTEAELLLFESARSQLVYDVISPALKQGKIVLSDRFYDSTTAYQGYGRGINLGFILRANSFATTGINPDLTLFIDVDPEVGLKKMKEGDKIANETLDFHKRVRQGYLEIAKKEPQRVAVIPYINDGINIMQQNIRQVLSERLGL